MRLTTERRTLRALPGSARAVPLPLAFIALRGRCVGALGLAACPPGLIVRLDSAGP